MPLQPQALSIPFTGGLETKTSDPIIGPGKLTRAENVVFTRPGEVAKRPGSAAIGTTGLAVPFSGSLGQMDNELVIAGSGKLLSYGAANQQWVSKGALRSPRVSTKGIFGDSFGQQHPDCASSGGITLYAWEELNAKSVISGVNVSLVDEATGAVLVPNLQVDAAGYAPRCVTNGGYLYVFYLAGAVSTSNLKFARFPIGSPQTAPSTGTTIASTVSNAFAVKATGNGAGDLMLTYATSTAVVIGFVDNTGTFRSGGGYPASQSHALSGVIGLNLVLAGGVWWQLAITGNLLGATFNATTLAPVTASTSLRTASGGIITLATLAADGAGFTCFYDLLPTSGIAYNAVTRAFSLTTALTFGSDVTVARSLALASDAWTDTTGPNLGEALVWCTYDDTTQPKFFLMTSSGLVIAKAMSESPSGPMGGGLTRTGNQTSGGAGGLAQLASAVKVSSTQMAFAFSVRGRFVSEAGNVTFFTHAIRRVTVDFTSERYRNVQLGETLHLGGGVLTGYDGSVLHEDGFHLYPPPPTGLGGSLSVTVTTFGETSKSIQVVTITPPPDVKVYPQQPSGSQVAAGSYILIFDSDVSGAPQVLCIWFNVGGAGSAPGFGSIGSWPSGFNYTEVEIKVLATDTAADICFNICTEVNRTLVSGGSVGVMNALWSPLTDTPTSALIGSRNETGPFTMPVDAFSMGYDVITPGTVSVAEITRLIFPAAAFITGGQSFVLESSKMPTGITINTAVQFYFVVTDITTSPTLPPQPATVFAQSAIDITSGMTPSQVAGAVATAILAFQRASTALWVKPSGVSTGAFGPIVEVQSAAVGLIFTTGTNSATAGILGQRNAGVGGSIGAGTRQYFLVYEWTDAQGQFHTSAPSAPFTAVNGNRTISGAPNVAQTGASNNAPTLSSWELLCPTLRVTRRDNVNIGVFRTIADEQGGGQVAYRIGNIPNNPAVDSVAFLDTLSDAAILTGDVLYTSGGELENISPAPALTLVRHPTPTSERVWLIDQDDPDLLWFSKEYQPGYAVAWSPELSLRIDKTGGPTVAAATIDTSLALFKANSIFLVVGAGPDATGSPQSGSYTAQRVSSDVGCVSQDSVVLTNLGLMFQGAKGICLLDRSGNVSYIGAPVESYTLTGLVTSAVLSPDQGRVRFATDAEVTLVYDIQIGEWSVYTYGSNHALELSTSGANVYTWVDDSGDVYQETPGTYVDPGATLVAMRVQTPWLHPGDAIQGFVRCWELLVLGQYLSAHGLTVEVAIDEDPTVVQTLTYTPPGSNVEQFRAHLGAAGTFDQKCQSIRFTITETPSVAGAGLVLQALQLKVGVKGTNRKVGPLASAT